MVSEKIIIQPLTYLNVLTILKYVDNNDNFDVITGRFFKGL